MDKAKYGLLFVLVVGALFLWGCHVRTYTVEKPRVDTRITGNQGYVSGQPKQEKKESKLSDKRKTTIVEIEYGVKTQEEVTPQEEVEQPQTLPKQPEGLFEEMPSEDDIFLEEPEAAVYQEPEMADYQEPEVQEAPIAQEKPRYKIYTVQKNDTLQKVSYKFFNTTRHWKKIYEANKDILKAPDRIFPGQVLKIPLE